MSLPVNKANPSSSSIKFMSYRLFFSISLSARMVRKYLSAFSRSGIGFTMLRMFSVSISGANRNTPGVRSNWTLRGDGIAAYGFGIPGIISWMGPWFMRTFDLGKPQAKKDYQIAKEAAALIIVHGEDTKESLLEAGEMFERFVLTATSLGLQYAFLNQPVEVRDLRTGLRTILGLADLPQLLFRIGYAKPQKRAMPRRPLDAVLIEG